MHPSVVEVVSAMVSAGAPRKRASAARTSSRRASIASKYSWLERPCFEVAGERGLHRLHGPARERPVRARVEIREPVEDGEAGADGV